MVYSPSGRKDWIEDDRSAIRVSGETRIDPPFTLHQALWFGVFAGFSIGVLFTLWSLVKHCG